jgi:predicted HTH transcriptional regulator
MLEHAVSDKLRVFVSSVEKELKDERLIVQNLLSTDSFLSAHCAPVLYECEPASPRDAIEDCLHTLDACQIYLLIVGVEPGNLVGGLPMTHVEYNRAKEHGLPVLAFILGERTLPRGEPIQALLTEVYNDRVKYKRFHNVVELPKEVRFALVKLLEESYGAAPSTDEDRVAEQTISATSPFESQLLLLARWQDLDQKLLARLVAGATGEDPERLGREQLASEARLRGLIWTETDSEEHYATAAGIVLLAKDPAASLPQCRILADTYRGTGPDSSPSDHEDVCLAAPLAVDRAVAFVDRNTRHPMRVVGLNRVRLDEYPIEALREALVIAVTHRQYEDSGRKITLEVFSDRVVGMLE